MIRQVIAMSIAVPLIVASAAAQGAAATPAAAPEIFFRSPADGATVNTSFPVVFGLRNFGVAPAGVNVTSAGHFHLLVNTQPGAPGTIIPTDSLHRHFGTGAIETTLTLAPGTYTLRLVLGDFEHKVINANLISRPIRVTVQR